MSVLDLRIWKKVMRKNSIIQGVERMKSDAKVKVDYLVG